MNRRKFLGLIGSGALAAMLVPKIAAAFESGELSQDELFDKINTDGGEGTLITQEAKIVARVLGPSRHDKLSIAAIRKEPPIGWDGVTFGADFEEALLTRGVYVEGAYQKTKTYKRGHMPVKDGEVVTMTIRRAGLVNQVS